MPSVTHIQKYGNQLAVLYDDGSRSLAYPSLGGMWIVSGSSGSTPSGDLIDWFTGPYGITGTWEDHSSYSQGGTDWGMPFNAPIKAPAAGTVVNYGDTDGAGLKSILIFDSPIPRKIAASGTLMNGTYRETDAGSASAAAFVIQHLNSQVSAGHVAQGGTIGYAGNTGSTTGQHLHAHLLAGTTIDDRRLDFMKFL